MKGLEFFAAAGAVRKGGTFLAGLVALTASAMLLLGGEAFATSELPDTEPPPPTDAVKFEDIPGSTLKRVILTARSAERLGIETGRVGEKPIIRTMVVSGVISFPEEIPPEKPRRRSGGFALAAPTQVARPAAARSTAPASDEIWVRISLSEGEWDRLAKDGTARLQRLQTRDQLAKEVLARPSGRPPIDDAKRAMLTVYYVVSGKDHGLKPGERVRVELTLLGSGEKRMVVPYSAVYYDAQGTAWVYVNTKPLVFERQRISIVRVVGDLAVLSEGPRIRTRVVTVGAALLYGAEVIYGR